MSTEPLFEDMDQWPDLPPSAYTDAGTSEINNDWLSSAPQAEQAAALLEWFQARFQDPAHETPYMSSEGGYIWIHGGPYDAKEELEERFSGLVPEEVITFVAEHVEGIDGIWEWAPTDVIYYDPEQDLIVQDKDVPLHRLEECLKALMAVLTLQGDGHAMNMARRLAYAGVVSALETFLWETMAYWVDHDEDTIKNLIKNHPEFRERRTKLGDIFELYDSLATQVKVHMQRMAWHRWDDAARFLEHGLGVTTPSFRAFDDPTKTRHDIIHRSGYDVDGNAIVISVEQVGELVEEVQRFATQIHTLIDQAKAPLDEAFEGVEP
ncbi:hypothetical protein [Xanthomonas bonasiae]|uniref:hypothetical protein n=1 Tax=Xanthomonas bonasiae TaxID=2810351 RepID=UPI00198042D6|nr:hypothetical protein [Xanthomonas bonasiae]MBN6111549.1 hypothetical protein [Xanthomonas bonasiae]